MTSGAKPFNFLRPEPAGSGRLRSDRKLTNAAGTVANTYDTEAFGHFETRLEAVVNPYTFTAREFDPESGLHFYRARYYDPLAGHFLSEDPIGFEGADWNLYRYVYNNPTNLVDPNGLSPLSEYAKEIAVLFVIGNIILRDALDTYRYDNLDPDCSFALSSVINVNAYVAAYNAAKKGGLIGLVAAEVATTALTIARGEICRVR